MVRSFKFVSYRNIAPVIAMYQFTIKMTIQRCT